MDAMLLLKLSKREILMCFLLHRDSEVIYLSVWEESALYASHLYDSHLYAKHLYAKQNTIVFYQVGKKVLCFFFCAPGSARSLLFSIKMKCFEKTLRISIFSGCYRVFSAGAGADCVT